MKSPFENYAREQLSEHEIEVDIEALWDSVEPHVKPKKKRRFIWFFFGGTALAAFILAILFWNNDKNHLGNFQINTQNIAAETNGNIDLNNESGVQNTDLNAKKEFEKENLVSKNEISKSDVKVSNSNNLENLSDNEINKVIQFNEENAVFDNELNNSNELEKRDLPNLNDELVQNTTLEKLPFLNPNLIWDSKFPALNPVLPELADEKNCPPDYKNWSIGIHGGVSYSFMKLDTVERLFNNHLQQRRDSESQLETLHLGFDAAFQSKKNWYLKTGLEYTRIAQKFQRTREEFSEIVIPDTLVALIINPAEQDTIYENGPIVLGQKDQFIKRTYNYFHLLDVPVILGYRLQKDKWSYGIEAGVLVNVFHKISGEILNSNGSIYDLEKDRNNWFKDNLGIRGIVNLDIGYQLNENWKIAFSPTFRFGTKYHENIDTPIYQKSFELGVNLGLRYSF